MGMKERTRSVVTQLIAWATLCTTLLLIYNDSQSRTVHPDQSHKPHLQFHPIALPGRLLRALESSYSEERLAELKKKGLWPPLQADYDLKREVHPSYDKTAPVVVNFSVPKISHEMGIKSITISHSPRIEYFPTFLSDEEAKTVIEMSEKHMAPSGVGKKRIPGGKQGRTSDGYRLPRKIPFVKMLEKRITQVTGFRGDIAERLYVLRYQEGQYYHKHLDTNEEIPRAATFFTWLEDLDPPAKGAWTSWPMANGRKRGFECVTGLRARPVRGAAVLFYDMNPDGSVDPSSAHAGCPPVDGVKWAMTKWLQIDNPHHGKHGKKKKRKTKPAQDEDSAE